jgi:hypothetical protein
VRTVKMKLQKNEDVTVAFISWAMEFNLSSELN